MRYCLSVDNQFDFILLPLLQREVQKRGRFPQIFFDVGGRIYEIDEYKSNPSRSSNFCNT